MKTQTALAFLFAVLLSGCATTEFTPWEGSNVQTGSGGTRKSVAGIDIWENGTPPRRYQVIGIIDDSRDDNDIVLTSIYDDIAKKVREVGGNGVIIVSATREKKGTYISPTTTTVKVSGDRAIATTMPGYARDEYQKDTKWQVIRYVQ